MPAPQKDSVVGHSTQSIAAPCYAVYDSLRATRVWKRRTMQKLLITLLMCAAAVWAQFDSAAVLGSVRDSAGLPVQRSKVTLQNAATGVQLEVVSDEAGNYQFLTVKAGRYTRRGGGAGLQERRPKRSPSRSTRASGST